MTEAQLYFQKYQRELLRFANTEGGRFLLGIKDKDPIIKIIPHGFHQLRDFDRKGRPILTAKLFWEDRCYDLAYALIKMQSACGRITHPMTMIGRPIRIENPHEAFLHYAMLQNSRKNYPLILLATFSSSTWLGGAGNVYHTDPTFSTFHDASTGTTATGGTYEAYCDHGSGYRGQRCYLPINTSSIGAGATVTATDLNFLSNRSLSAPSENILVAITQTAQATVGSLATSEWGNKGAGVKTHQWLEVNNTPTDHTASFDATGLTWINVSGNSLLGVREVNYDINNTAPTATDGNKAQITGTKTLTVTYTPAPSGMMMSSEI